MSDPVIARSSAWRPWIWLGIGFAPVLQNLLANLRDEPFDRYTLLAALLLLLLIRRGDPEPARRPLGAALVAVGLAAQLLGIAAGTWSLARLGLPTAMLGLALYRGQPALAPMLLGFALIPIPDFIHMFGSPAIESSLGRGAAAVLALLDLPVEVGGPLLRYGDLRLELLPEEHGLETALVLAQLGYFIALRAGASIGAACARALAFGLAALVVQPLLVLVGVATLPLGVPELGRFIMSHAPWLGAGLYAIWGELGPTTRGTTAP